MPTLAENPEAVTAQTQPRASSPKAATRRAMAELEQGKGKRFDSADALLEGLGI